jgi:hypothetical protein
MQITRTKAVELIENTKGRFFTVTFTKKDNTERTMNCNHKKNAITKLGYVTVKVPKLGYRNINPQTISKLVVAGQTYNVK